MGNAANNGAPTFSQTLLSRKKVSKNAGLSGRDPGLSLFLSWKKAMAKYEDLILALNREGTTSLWSWRREASMDAHCLTIPVATEVYRLVVSWRVHLAGSN
jgi:hypothetical protein